MSMERPESEPSLSVAQYFQGYSWIPKALLRRHYPSPKKGKTHQRVDILSFFSPRKHFRSREAA